MPKTIKIPLEMQNGEKATDMKSLVANFDVESVVGYFLDGKLKKWLDDRWYEEEAEKVSQLEKDDPALAAKLCEIFGVPYEAELEIDTEELAERKERLSHLKQLTDDEEILHNIDSVAFNQEELAELYDKGVQKIYLCEGDFHIPKSKQELEYVLIADATVEGLPKKESATTNDAASLSFSTTSQVKIPEYIADKIGEKYYVDLDDYIVYSRTFGGNLLSPFGTINIALSVFKEKGPLEDGPFKAWNKRTGEEFSFDIDSPGWIFNRDAVGTGNYLLLSRPGTGVLLYDVANGQKETICPDCSGRGGLSASDGSIAYYDGSYLVLYNITSKKAIRVTDLGYTPEKYDFFLCGTKLLYRKNNAINIFDIETQEHTKLFSMSDYCIEQIVTYNDRLFFSVYNVHDNFAALWSIDLRNLPDRPTEHLRFDVENGYWLKWIKQSAPYFVFIKEENSCEFPILSFNMDTEEFVQITIESDANPYINKFQVVGDYLYFIRGEDDKELCRFNLSDPMEAPKITKYES